MKSLGKALSPFMGRVVVALLAAFPLMIPMALAQDYPSRPITLIVPLAAGGSTDVLARILADRMKDALGQPIVVENIPTAAGVVGVGRLAQAAPDGYTIGMGDQTSNLVSSFTNPVRYDVLKDLAPIALLTTSPIVLVSRKTLPPVDMKQLIAWLREHPEGALAGSFGKGSGPNIISAAFQRLTGSKLRMVTYRGNLLALQDVISGQIDLLFTEQGSTIGPLRGGAVKAYAVLGRTRSTAVPEVPTIEEAGGPPLNINTWRGMWVPKSTPDAITKRLGAAVIEALGDEIVRKRIAEISQEIVPRDKQTPEALAAHHRAEIEKWVPMIKAASGAAESPMPAAKVAPRSEPK
jgi:tripartite-type tricarboxylate transporter receptor subunit TctC